MGSNNILVVGDWAVDEYWLLAKHQSPSSAHTGHIHYRVTDKSIDLCGAGHVARVLYQTFEKKENIYGAGLWNKNDENTITCLIQAPNKEGKKNENEVICEVNIGFSLAPIVNKSGDSTNIQLMRLADNGPTTHIIRQYIKKKCGGLEQLDRVDWNIEIDSRNENAREYATEVLSKTKDKEITNIVIFDLIAGDKGVVTQNLIEDLDKTHKNVNWYVRSKELNPEWLKKIKNGKVKLLIMGPELTEKINLGANILVGKENIIPSVQEAMREIDNNNNCENIVLVSYQREVIALNGKDYITAALSALPEPRSFYLGWTTAFFASLVYEMSEGQNDELDGGKIKKAFDNTYNYIRTPFSNDNNVAKIPLSEDKLSALPWEDIEKKYKEATNNRGIIGEFPDQRVLEIFRGYSVIPGYVACITEKQKIIKEIGKELATFRKDSLRIGSVSIMLSAGPGAGKTFLAEKLSETFDFTFLHFDITQMVNRDDLLDLFDRIANEQAKSDRPVLVFVDEINALLVGNPVYGAFLSLLEAGTYVRHEGAFKLKPCAWLFTGTMTNNDIQDSIEKLPDFKSRLTIDKNINYSYLHSEYCRNNQRRREDDDNLVENQARLEQVYLGAITINRRFPAVQSVCEEVLEVFQGINPNGASPAREIRKLVYSLENVSDKVIKDNCKEGWITTDWPVRQIEDLVKLDFSS